MKINYIFCINFLIICTFAKISFCFNTNDYCKAGLCRRGVKHVGCNNNGALSPRCPPEAEFIDLGNHRDMVLRSHNEHRNMVALGKLQRFKPAVRMATMKWDDELAKLAEFNVKKCVMQHDQCYNTKQFKNAGQCLAFTSYHIPEGFNINDVFSKAMDMWFNEHNNTDMRMIENFKFDRNKILKYGHFLQVVVERNSHVGCAAVQFNFRGYPNFKQVLIACNYAAVYGIDFPIYEPGRATSKCETGSNPEYPGLCSNNENFNPNYYDDYGYN